MEFQMREQEFCLEIWYVANFFYHVPYWTQGLAHALQENYHSAIFQELVFYLFILRQCLTT
jgi:hypothetical protein